MSTPNSRLSIAELMKLKFDEVQSIMMEREKKMEMEMGSLVKFHHVLKKEINTLESSTSIEKCSLEEKLQRSEMRCEALEKRFTQKQEENEKLLVQKWDAEEKLEKSVRECEELRSEKFYAYERMEEKLEKLSREKLDVEEKLEKLSREKLDVDMKIVEKEVKIEDLWDEVWEVEEKLKIKGRECEELKRTVQELRVKKAQSDEDARVYKARVHDLEVKMSKVKANLAGLVGSMNDTNFTDHFVENREVVILDPPQGLSNKAGASSKAPIAPRWDLGIIDQIKKNLEKNNLKRFEKSCFGHFLKVKKLQYQGPLILHMVQSMDVSASNEERLVFNINNTNINFGPTEFSLMTGLRLGTFEAATPSSSSIHSDVFQGNPRILLKDIKDAFLATSRDNEGKGELTLKLALLYFLYGVLLARSRRVNRIELQYLNLIEDIDNFNTFPWGRVAYDFLVSSILAVGDRVHGSDQVTYGRAGLDIHGFDFAVQAWAYEVMPRVAAYCASRAKNFNSVTPLILRWSATKGVRFNSLSKFFPPTHLKIAVVKEEEPSSVPQQKKRKSNLIEEGRCGKEGRK